jgi:hypothetical protein
MPLVLLDPEAGNARDASARHEELRSIVDERVVHDMLVGQIPCVNGDL